MLRYILSLIILFLFSFLFAQNNSWSVTFKGDEAFVKNEGQFDRRGWEDFDSIKFGLKMGSIFTYYTKNGLTYRFEKFRKGFLKQDNELDNNTRRYLQSELINVEFLNANPNVSIETLEQTPYTFSYGIKVGDTATSINNVTAFKRIKYINIYNNIDIEYFIHPDEGVKYNVILHPGANPDDIQFKYTTKSLNSNELIDIELLSSGDLQIKTDLGTITEKAPITFYESTNTEIVSSYSFNNNILSFHLDNYDNTQKVIIDPWVISPAFNAGDFTREVETDAVGNIYTIGGELPMVLRKYTSAGALVWQYNTPWDTINGDWLGTLATNDAGVSFITQGTGSEIERISTAGTMDWHQTYTPGGLSTEFWSITFNCDDNKLIVGGTGSVGLFGFRAVVYDIDPATGTYNNLTEVHNGTAGLGTPVEVRSISSSKNARYVFLTHLDVGSINQNIGSCPSDVPIYKVPNKTLGYKCENFLSADQNGGGLKAVVANDNFFYVHNGDEIKQFDVNTGALINTVALPGGSANSGFGGTVVHCSGLDVDLNGNVYAGSMDRVVKFDPNLNVLASINTTGGFTVYDVSVSSNGEVIAGGAMLNNSTSTNRGSRIESLNFSTLGKYDLVCCDANICPAGPFCDDALPQQLIANTPGGTWSGTGVSSTGVFNPASVGAGNYTITYTLPCGSSSIFIVVNNCTSPLSVCLQADGSITAVGGTSPYTWESFTATTTCTAPGSLIDNDCTVSCGFFCFEYYKNETIYTYTNLGNGSTLNVPIPYPIRVTDGNGDEIVINSSADVTTNCPTGLPVEFGDMNLTCLGRNVLMEWTTITEKNNDYFIIEKALENGIFNEIGRINGAGNSTSILNYKFIDANRNTELAFYRIRQVDFDGKESIGSIKTINCAEEGVQIYPNPFHSEIKIVYGDFIRSQKGKIEIINNLGQVVFSREITNSSDEIIIPTNEFKTGFYFVKISAEGKLYTEKLIKN